tara:strand:- start:3023 stop:3862 length:840 start_codon:yes stop_codon:yes gene_type:complete
MSDDELTLDDVTEDIPPQIDDEEVEEVEEDSTDEPESGNPAWDELLDVLPKSLHGMVKPVLDKWQSGIDSEFEKIAPYRKFADADVNPQIIEASMDLARQVQSNPKAVYDELAQRYGWSAAQQMVEEASDNLEEAEEMDLFDDSESTSELKALKSELDALKSTITSQQEASEQEALSNQIEESLQSLGKEAGDFDQEAVVRRAMLLADDYPDADIAQLIQAGYEQYSGEVEKMRSSIKKAPRVAGGSANKSPAAPVKTLNTREDRINAIEEIVKRTLNI